MTALHTRLLGSAFLLSMSAASAAHAADTFLVTYEKPGVYNSTATFDYKGVETFEGRATGTSQTFSTTFGTSLDPVVITGLYTGVDIAPHDQYGGAGGTGNFATTFSRTGYSLNLSAVETATSDAKQVNYFGFWLSALDGGNQVSFYRGADLVFSFDPNAVVDLLGSSCPGGSFCSNPATGENGSQAYVFLNFYDQSGLGFDRVVFYETQAQAGYESDNHTVGYFTQVAGTPVNDVPEPASLALVGVALAGLGIARRRAR